MYGACKGTDRTRPSDGEKEENSRDKLARERRGQAVSVWRSTTSQLSHLKKIFNLHSYRHLSYFVRKHQHYYTLEHTQFILLPNISIALIDDHHSPGLGSFYTINHTRMTLLPVCRHLGGFKSDVLSIFFNSSVTVLTT